MMKKQIFFLTLIILGLQVNAIAQTIESADASTQVGDYVEGGIVFHIYQSGEDGYVAGEENGLVCGINDIHDYPCSWEPMDRTYYGDGGIYTSLGTAQKMGSGRENTQKIIDHFRNASYTVTFKDCDNRLLCIHATVVFHAAKVTS